MSEAITITRIGAGGYAGATATVPSAKHPIPRGWTSAPLPALQEGEYAVWRAGGWTVTDQPYAAPEPTLEEVKPAAHIDIDRMAGEARSQALTVVPGQELTYVRKEDQAMAYLALVAAEGTPVDSDYPLLQASIGADAFPAGHPSAGQLVSSVAEAAQVVALVSAAWTAMGAQIEKVRLRGKRLVTLAEDQAGVDAIKAWCAAAYTAALAGESLPAEPE